MYRKLIAKRKLKNTCECCGKHLLKGDVYYKERTVVDEGVLYAYNSYLCPKCRYKEERHQKRFNKFKDVCKHPQEFIETEWDYIPGECVKEPQYDYCKLCGKIF